MVYENLFRHILYPLYETVLRRRKTFSYYRNYESNQWLSLEEIQRIQWRALTDLIAHCYEHVPYYQKLWRELGIHPRDIKSLADFEKLPVITKTMVKENYDQLMADNYRDKTMTKTTGGSTGSPFRFEYTQESYQRRTAVAWRGYGWSGLPPGRRTAYLWGADLGEVPAFKKLKLGLYQWAFNRRTLNSFAMSQDNLDSYVKELNDYRPEGIVSYVAPLYTLARHIKDTGKRIHAPKAIITGAEPLLEFQRELIQEVFRCPVSNTYGCREVMLIAAECLEQNGLHINQDHLVVETLDASDNPVRRESGRVAITDLYNYGMPLLRYMNGDLATLSEERCRCGRGLPLMRSVEGRELDSIRTSSGAIVPGEFFPHLLKDLKGILTFQVIQDNLAGVTISLVRDDNFEQQGLDFVSAEIRKLAGPDFDIHYDFVDHIELTASGKRRVTLSRL